MLKIRFFEKERSGPSVIRDDDENEKKKLTISEAKK